MSGKSLRGRLVGAGISSVSAVLLAAGCATGQPGAGVSPSASDSSGTSPAGMCQLPTGTTVMVTEAQNGRVVCARVSQRIEVYLRGTASDRWGPISAQGAALQPAASGKLSLPIGVTGAVFSAVAVGQAELVATRPMCSALPVGGDCPQTMRFHVTVSIVA